MKYEELNDLLGQRFPNFLPIIAIEMDTFDCYKPGPHVLYGNVLNAYVTDLLKKEENPNALTSVFSFYEELAQSEDVEVRNLLQVTLLEVLWDDRITYERARKYMLPSTRRINGLIGEYLRLPPGATNR